ncbi:sugar ABC transporter permease [Paracoccaceae bacterium]|jgi:sorbitol/mannitol transport system permease protein|nr:sugar ABC transporter permease [Paracoccaceae bacterium]OAH07486.1 Inner membrane ABC transporter permease protein YcjO [Rhodobacteraceae bacterium SB2]WQC61629.1 sugar ABC transporter permease [Alphaproteobacteria bacterium US3C007]MBT4230662.1 sugar ABC transporter permease [Paracoccaceae bacterium]MBT4953161.1 sugar ABC transporter permease [Paracoccaceae bacterium]
MSDRSLPRLLQTPAVLLLLVWMLVPLSMTLYFSFIRYVLNSLRRPEWTKPAISNWRGFGNYEFVLNNKDFLLAIQNSLLIVCSIIILTVVLGVFIAVLINKSFPGQGIVRVLLISPFFVMPAVNAVLWINMILDPVLGLQGLAIEGLNQLIENLQNTPLLGNFFSLWPEFEPISFRATQTSAYAVIMMVTWQWTPFAVLIFMTSLQSEDIQQKEAAILDGAGAWSQFRFLTLPHLGRPIAIVVMIQAIFHLSLYAEIEIVSRGNGNKNLPYLIGEFANNNIGAASATGIIAVILANIVAIFLLRMLGKTLME